MIKTGIFYELFRLTSIVQNQILGLTWSLISEAIYQCVIIVSVQSMILYLHIRVSAMVLKHNY